MSKDNKDKNKRPKLKHITLNDICMILAIILLAGMFVYELYDAKFKTDLSDPNILFEVAIEEAQYIPYKEFTSMLEKDLIDTVYYHTGNEKMAFTLWNVESKLAYSANETWTYTIDDIRITDYPAGETFREDILQYNCRLTLIREKGISRENMISLLIGIIPVIATVLVLVWWLRSSSSNPVGEIKSDEVIQVSTVTLDDIIGLDETKEELQIIINLIKNTIEGIDIGAKPPKGILLSGPPGVGKTMIAKAISNEAGVPFISMSGSDFQEIYVGSGSKHVRELFKLARENAPCIIFIDELDAIGSSRDSASAGSEDRRTINALLKEIDGFKELDNVFILAATNYPDLLDKAIVRSGRFDREIVINPPRDWRDREALFKFYLKDKKIADDVDLEVLSKTLVGFTGADIASICNEAALVAIGLNKSYVDDLCMSTAVDRKLFKGTYTKKKVLEEDRITVAYHEAGHAVANLLLGEKVTRASIKSTTSGVGGVVFGAESESQFITKELLRTRIKTAYAGRVAEELFLKDITAGASNDIIRATEMILAYICEYGFDEKIGLVNTRVITKAKSDSPYAKRVGEIAEELHKETYELLSNNTELIDRLALKLLECETMSGKEITDYLFPKI